MIPEKYKFEKPCYVCGKIKTREEFNLYQQKCKECENKQLFKCCRCKQIKEKSYFSRDSSKKSGVHGSCKSCKGKIKRIRIRKYKKRKRTPLRKLRDFFKDCLKRLDKSKDNKLYDILGFTKNEFQAKFPTIPKGYDIDHMIPLSWFKEEVPIKISCSLHNLQLLHSKINSAKRNFFCDKPLDTQYIIDSQKYIKEEYLEMYRKLL